MKNSGVEWIGEIPDDWEVTPLKKLFSFGKGLPITKENLVEKGLPVISYGQIHSKSNTGTKLQSELLRYVSNSYLDSNPNSLVHSGDFIFADTSEDLEGCGNCCYIDKEIKLFAGYHTVILQSKISKDNKYLAYLFKTDEWRKQLREKLVEVKLYSITQKALKSTSVILPPKPTQQHIASYLDKKCSKIEETIQKQQQVIEKLKGYKQSLITEAVTGKIKIQNGKACGKYEEYKDSGVEWIGKIPSGWISTRVGHLYKSMLGKMVCPNQLTEEHSLQKYLCAMNVHFEGVDLSEIKEMWFTPNEMNRYQVRNEDLLVVEGGAGAGGAAIVSGLSEDDNIFIQNSIHLVKPVKEEYLPKYLYYWIYSLVKQNYIDYTCNKATIPHFTKEKLEGMPIAITDKKTQQEIIEYLDKKCTAIDSAIEQKQELIVKLTEYKKSLIYECVTGKKEI